MFLWDEDKQFISKSESVKVELNYAFLHYAFLHNREDLVSLQKKRI